MDLRKYIGEATEYDKKAMLEEKKPKSWCKSVSAFANGKGGVLIFGITNDDVVIGVEAPEKVAEKISETITAKLDPIPDTTLKFEVVDGKTLIFLEVATGSQTPYYYVSDGTRIAFVRVGNESIPASATDLRRLVLRGSNSSFDSLSTRYPFESLAFTKLRSVYRMRTGTELTDSDFVSFELVDENNMLTNAGVLLADDSPMRHSRLFCTRWYGLNKASGIMDALDDKEYSGSLVSLLQNGIEFVKNNTKKRWKKTGNGRIEMPEYPEQAVHEVIVNALIHRDYMELGSEVHIDIFDDRMEVYSPGGMFDGSIVQDLDTDNVASKRRNPVIADIFSRMHFMERRGSGFKKIKADYRRAVNYRAEVEPMFRSTPTSFFATLYNLNYNIPIENVLIDPQKVAVDGENVLIASENLSVEAAIDALNANQNTKKSAKKLFKHMGFDGVFGRNDIMDIMNISITAAGNLINKLKAAKLIEPVLGKGKGKYKFARPKQTV